MDRLFISLGACSAFLAVGLGAFGAHALRGRLDEHMLAVWHTAVQYHLIHSVGLMLTGILVHLFSETGLLKLAGWLFALGIFLFSGSLYLLAIFEIRKLGMVTPLGGLAFLGGWLVLTLGMIRQ